MICSRRLYKGNSYEICLPLFDTGVTSVRFYTRGDIIIEKEPVITGDSMCFSFAKEELDVLPDGVLRYEAVTEYDTIDTNTPYVIVTPGDYSGTTLDEIIEEAYHSGYTDGYASGYTDGYSTCHHDYSKDYLTLEFFEDGQFNISRRGNLFYSLDEGNTWINAGTPPYGTIAIDVSSGDTISLKWVMDTLGPGIWGEAHSPITGNTIGFNVYGNYLSMVFGDDFKNSGESLISKTSIVCLFQGCTGLKDASNMILPSTILWNHSYDRMFSGCVSLVAAPELPATTLGWDCYMGMFEDCTSLTTAPVLPATTLEGQCYRHMFSGCTSLVTAPILPAITLESACYSGMFSGCTSLNYIKCLATDISASFCMWEWVNGVASSGTLVKAASMSSWPTGPSGIPSGWTVVDAE